MRRRALDLMTPQRAISTSQNSVGMIASTGDMLFANWRIEALSRAAIRITCSDEALKTRARGSLSDLRNDRKRHILHERCYRPTLLKKLSPRRNGRGIVRLHLTQVVSSLRGALPFGVIGFGRKASSIRATSSTLRNVMSLCAKGISMPSLAKRSTI